MKLDEEVKVIFIINLSKFATFLINTLQMIAGETPILFSKACELFMIELAYRSWVHTLESNRRTLQVIMSLRNNKENKHYQYTKN